MSDKCKDHYLDLLNSCADGCTAPYCFYRMFLEHEHPSERVLIQIKCLEKIKWIWSKESGKDIGWNEAGFKWALEGYAKAFANVYNSDYSIQENFDNTLDEQKRIDLETNPTNPTNPTKENKNEN